MDKQESLDCSCGEWAVVKSENTSKIQSLSRGSVERKLSECSQGLINLDNAVNSVADLCSNIANTASEDLFSEPGSELRIKAALLLPSICEKINAIARLFQSSDDSSRTRDLM